MSSCCSSLCAGAVRQFDRGVAEGDLRRYRRRGPNPTTKLMRDGILRAGGGRGVLDVGAGIAALSLELLAAGAERAMAVDASPAYVAVARDEAGRRGLADRLTVLEGDFVALAGDVAAADVVAMDRVVCCYPAFEPLLRAALARAGRLFVFSYPRDRWYVRVVVRFGNLVRAARHHPFRTFVHDVAAMRRLAEELGFRLVSRRGTLAWHVDVYARADAT